MLAESQLQVQVSAQGTKSLKAYCQDLSKGLRDALKNHPRFMLGKDAYPDAQILVSCSKQATVARFELAVKEHLGGGPEKSPRPIVYVPVISVSLPLNPQNTNHAATAASLLSSLERRLDWEGEIISSVKDSSLGAAPATDSFPDKSYDWSQVTLTSQMTEVAPCMPFAIVQPFYDEASSSVTWKNRGFGLVSPTKATPGYLAQTWSTLGDRDHLFIKILLPKEVRDEQLSTVMDHCAKERVAAPVDPAKESGGLSARIIAQQLQEVADKDSVSVSALSFRGGPMLVRPQRLAGGEKGSFLATYIHGQVQLGKYFLLESELISGLGLKKKQLPGPDADPVTLRNAVPSLPFADPDPDALPPEKPTGVVRDAFSTTELNLYLTIPSGNSYWIAGVGVMRDALSCAATCDLDYAEADFGTGAVRDLRFRPQAVVGYSYAGAKWSTQSRLALGFSGAARHVMASTDLVWAMSKLWQVGTGAYELLVINRDLTDRSMRFFGARLHLGILLQP